MSKTFIVINEDLVVNSDDLVSIEAKDEGSIITMNRGKDLIYYFIKDLKPKEIIAKTYLYGNRFNL